MSRKLHKELLRQHCLTTAKGQVLIFTMHHTGPASLLCTVNGLVASNPLHMDDEKISTLWNDMASLLFKSVYTSILNYAMYIRPMHPTNSMENYNNAVQNILDRLSVKVLPICHEGNVVRPSVNLYLNLPGKSNVRRTAIIDEVRETNFRTTHFGRGFHSPGWVCALCRAINHPSDLCPFSLLPDWDTVTRKPKAQAARAAQYSSSNLSPAQGFGQKQGPPSRDYRQGNPGKNPNQRGQSLRGYRGRGQ